MNAILILGAVGLAMQAPEGLDAALDAASAVPAGDTQAYLAARAAVLAFGAPAVAPLEERGAAANWTAQGWPRALVAESCRLRLTQPGLAAALDRPAGLDPENYLRLRNPGPAVLRELSGLGAGAVPLALERRRWLMDEYPWSPGPAGERERDVLRDAVPAVAERYEDPRARHFLRDLVTDGAAPGWERRRAAIALGPCGGPSELAFLTSLVDDPAAAPDVREGAAMGLGGIPDLAAAQALSERLGGDLDAFLVAALGKLGSSWAWQARGPEAQAAGDAVRLHCAQALVGRLRVAPGIAESIRNALALTASPESLQMLEAVAEDRSESGAVRAAAREALTVVREAMRSGR